MLERVWIFVEQQNLSVNHIYKMKVVQCNLLIVNNWVVKNPAADQINASLLGTTLNSKKTPSCKKLSAQVFYYWQVTLYVDILIQKISFSYLLTRVVYLLQWFFLRNFHYKNQRRNEVFIQLSWDSKKPGVCAPPYEMHVAPRTLVKWVTYFRIL